MQKDTRFWKREDSQFILSTYGERRIAFVKGKGVYLYDVEGNKYLDFLSGIGVNILGHGHPRIVKVIKEQAEILLHTSNLYLIPHQIKLAEMLVQLSFPGRCFFCNSGTEAVEAALKLARKWGKEKGKFEIISMENSFHGRTCGSLSLTGQKKYQENFLPLLPGVRFIPFNNLEALQKSVNSKTCAIIIEPIQGEGGIHVASREFLEGAREIADKREVLLIFDEVQCGMGRTGKLFAYQNFEVIPDVLCLAKGLGGGLPIGVIIARDKFSDVFQPGDHASTFGGNPLVTRVAWEVIRILKEEKVLQNVEKMGKYLLQKLLTLKQEFPWIKEIRGKGLMIGIEISKEAKRIKDLCERKGLLIGTAGEKTLRFLPPLIISQEEIDEGMRIFQEVLEKL